MGTTIDIPALSARLHSALTSEEQGKAQLRVLGESGLQVQVDGVACLTNIGVWPNGCCDIESLYTETNHGEFRHIELVSLEEALEVVLPEVRRAIARACSV